MTSGGEARGSSLGFRDGCGMRRALGRLKPGLYSVIGLLGASGKLGEEIFVNNAAGCSGGGSRRKWKFHSLRSRWRPGMQMPVCNKCLVSLGCFFCCCLMENISTNILQNELKLEKDLCWTQGDVQERTRNFYIRGTAPILRPPTHSTLPLKHHTAQNKGEKFFVFSTEKKTHERM